MVLRLLIGVSSAITVACTGVMVPHAGVVSLLADIRRSLIPTLLPGQMVVQNVSVGFDPRCVIALQLPTLLCLSSMSPFDLGNEHCVTAEAIRFLWSFALQCAGHLAAILGWLRHSHPSTRGASVSFCDCMYHPTTAAAWLKFLHNSA